MAMVSGAFALPWTSAYSYYIPNQAAQYQTQQTQLYSPWNQMMGEEELTGMISDG